MSFSDTYDTILTRFKGQMDTLRPLVPIAWPNMPFDPLDDFNPATHQGWARIGVQGGEQLQASIGGTSNRRWRQVGNILVQVFTPTDEGANTALAIADDVGTALRGITISGVVFKASSVVPVGREGDDPYYQVNINTPFRYDLMA
jgi:hypothetical protein